MRILVLNSGSSSVKFAVLELSGSESRALVSGDGFVAFTTSEMTTHKMIGLSHGNTNTACSAVIRRAIRFR